MNRLTRRSFLAGSTAAVAAPALSARAQSQSAPEIDVIIVGAGAAGIAAARRVAGAGRTFVLLEATNRIGGRCVTDTRSFGVPFDRGAHLIHGPQINPLIGLAAQSGLDIYRAPSGQRMRVGTRDARAGELEDFLAGLVRANRAIGEAGQGKSDVNCAKALPEDLGDWRPSIEFALGPFSAARDLDEISALDLSKSIERDTGAFCRQGYGALLGRLAEGVPVQLGVPVTEINTIARAGAVEVTTANGTLHAGYVIVTASTAVLASGKIRIDRDLPKRHGEALERLMLGSFDHIAFDFAGNPLGLQPDDLVFEKAAGPRTAALLANVSGTSLSLIEVGGRFGRGLAAQGEKVMIDFAVEWLAGLFGSKVKGAVRRPRATNWNAEPWVLGAYATASPGGQWARRALMQPVRDRLFFAGEAVHETQWGTVGGAWESGERAADAVLRRLAGVPDPEPPAPEPLAAPETSPRRRPRRR
jgi:monoamine oxidase